VRPIFLPLLAVLSAVAGCDPAENVEVLPLPALERPSREARLGIPEVAGSWRFAGWEIIRGDTTALERTFPSFGELRLDTQRLDSIAGTFDLAGGRRGVMGEVRRDGNISLVTYGAGELGSFIAGRFASDTLWLELASVLAPEEWPSDARAAFVRTPVQEPITWLRGAGPGTAPPPADSSMMVDSLGRPISPATTAPSGALPGAQPGLRPGGQAQPPAATPSGQQPSRPQPSGVQQPAITQPQPRPTAPSTPPSPRPAAPPAAPPAARPSPPPAPAPAPPPAPEPEPQDDAGPPLLGDPVL
jgi:hypothetical protein